MPACIDNMGDIKMPGYSDPGFDTLALHAGAEPDPATGARAVAHPPDHVVRLRVERPRGSHCSTWSAAGHVYSRISNPTNAVLEQRVAALEGGVGAIATASGQAALHLAIATLMGAGSHIVSSSTALVWRLAEPAALHACSRFGIETTFVKPGDMDGWRAAARPNTKPVFWRDRGQPRPGCAGHSHRILANRARGRRATAGGLHAHLALAHASPSSHGADLVYHSATKFLSAGMAPWWVASWSTAAASTGRARPKSSRQVCRARLQPYDGFHNMVFTEESTVGAFSAARAPRGLARLWRLHEPAQRPGSSCKALKP